MKRKILYGLWAFFYILCAALGHIPEPEGAQATAMTVLAVVSFVPGVWLLADALREKCRPGLLRVRLISGLSLSLTLAALIANIASTSGSETLGNVLYVILIWVSSPMICSGHWVLSLFLWACIFCGTFFSGKIKN